MSKPSMRFPIAILVLMTATPLLAVASIDGLFERSYTVTGAVELEVLTRSGDISVRSGPAGTITVRGKIHVGDHWFTGTRQGDVNEIEKNPPITQNGNSIHIDYLNYHDISIDYEITAPADTSVQTHSGSGDQRMEGLSGKLNLESGAGDVRLRGSSGEVLLIPSSGDVDAHDISAAFDIECGSGDVRVEANGGSGDARVRTGSGNIELRGVSGALQVESGSGDLTISGT